MKNPLLIRFLNHFLISGALIATLSVFIETQNHNIPVAMAYSGIPLVAIYLILVAYNAGGANNVKNLTMHLVLAGIFIAPVFHLLIYYTVDKTPIYSSIIIATTLVFIWAAIYYKYIGILQYISYIYMYICIIYIYVYIQRQSFLFEYADAYVRFPTNRMIVKWIFTIRPICLSCDFVWCMTMLQVWLGL